MKHGSFEHLVHPEEWKKQGQLKLVAEGFSPVVFQTTEMRDAAYEKLNKLPMLKPSFNGILADASDSVDEKGAF